MNDVNLPEVPDQHEEPIASVLSTLRLRIGADGAFEADSLPQFRAQLYGGQVLAQGLIAAAAVAPNSRLPHSSHTYFMRPGAADKTVAYKATQLRQGRSFGTVQVNVAQGSRELALMAVSFQERQEGATFSMSMPDVPGPNEVPSALELVTSDHPVGKFLGRTASFDMRHVSGHLYTGDKCAQSDRQYVWLRPRSNVPDCAQIIHRALLTYVSDQFMLEPALRTQQLTWLSPQLALATLDHSMWYLRDTDINDWHLFAQRALSAQGGRSLTHASIFRADGTLVAECMQEGMLRAQQGSSWSFNLPPVP